jgi:hypothetical protein
MKKIGQLKLFEASFGGKKVRFEIPADEAHHLT